MIVVTLMVLPALGSAQLAATIQSRALYERLAVYRGSNTSLAISAAGTPPFSYQWRLDGIELPGQTKLTLSIAAAQPADEGYYSAVVTNAWGSVTSAPVRLYVTPLASEMIRCDLTNSANLRLPYWYLLPDNYDPARRYPLVCVLHGNPGGETFFRPTRISVRKPLGWFLHPISSKQPSLRLWSGRPAAQETPVPGLISTCSKYSACSIA